MALLPIPLKAELDRPPVETLKELVDAVNADRPAGSGEVTERQLNYYRSIGLLPPPRKGKTGGRWTGFHILAVKVILALQEQGYSIREIGNIVKGLRDKEEFLERLERAEGHSALHAMDITPYLEETAPGRKAASDPPTRERQSGRRTGSELLTLGPKVELIVRHPLNAAEEKKVQELIALARKLFDKS